MFALFDAKINFNPNILWGIGVGIIAIIGTTVKVLTRNHISKNEVYKNMQSKSFCNERAGNIEEKIDNLKEHISERFDDLKSLIEKNGRK